MKAHALGQVGPVCPPQQDSESSTLTPGLARVAASRRDVAAVLTRSAPTLSLFSAAAANPHGGSPAAAEDVSSSLVDLKEEEAEAEASLLPEKGGCHGGGVVGASLTPRDVAASRYDSSSDGSVDVVSGGSSVGKVRNSSSSSSVPSNKSHSVPSNKSSSVGISWCSALASRCSMRRTQRMWVALLPLGAFFYIVFYCNSAIWQTLNINTHPLDNIITGSGFRKLLQERARLLEKPHPPGAVQRLPQGIIIGVRKCGTRALLEFLNLHPDIVTAEEEMHFFSADDRYRLGLEWYRRKMPYTLDGQITIEKTPKYFISHVAPARIHRLNSSMKLIVLLRHPTTRVVSDYTQVYFNKQVKNETWDDFEKIAVDPATGEVNTHYKAVQISIYHQFMHRWLSLFPRHQIHIVDGDQLIRDPVAEVVRVEEFLGLEHHVDYRRLYYNTTRGFYCMRVNHTMERCLGASKGRKHPKINPGVLRKLDAFFRPHNERLFRMIKRRFPWT